MVPLMVDNMNIKENERLQRLNHSGAHLLAQAVKHLYPNAKFWVGPVIEEGFYYDIDLGNVTLTEEDLPKIEKAIKKLTSKRPETFDSNLNAINKGIEFVK